jgi:hypothetical protein
MDLLISNVSLLDDPFLEGGRPDDHQSFSEFNADDLLAAPFEDSNGELDGFNGDFEPDPILVEPELEDPPSNLSMYEPTPICTGPAQKGQGTTRNVVDCQGFAVISPETEESNRMAHNTQLQAALNHLMHVHNFNFQQQEQQQSMDGMNHMFADPATRNQVITPVQQLPLGNSMNIGETQQTPTMHGLHIDPVLPQQQV